MTRVDHMSCFQFQHTISKGWWFEAPTQLGPDFGFWKISRGASAHLELQYPFGMHKELKKNHGPNSIPSTIKAGFWFVRLAGEHQHYLWCGTKKLKGTMAACITKQHMHYQTPSHSSCSIIMCQDLSVPALRKLKSSTVYGAACCIQSKPCQHACEQHNSRQHWQASLARLWFFRLFGNIMLSKGWQDLFCPLLFKNIEKLLHQPSG